MYFFTLFYLIQYCSKSVILLSWKKVQGQGQMNSKDGGLEWQFVQNYPCRQGDINSVYNTAQINIFDHLQVLW